LSFVIAGAVLALPVQPAVAAPCSDLDMVVATFASHGASVYIIPPERLAVVARDAEAITGNHYPGVTRGFLVRGKQSLIIGLEIGGCLLDPIRLPLTSPNAPKVAAA
jgi:hypothetical protein